MASTGRTIHSPTPCDSNDVSDLLPPVLAPHCAAWEAAAQTGMRKSVGLCVPGRQLSLAVCAVAAAEALQACDVLVRRAAHGNA